MRRWFKSLQAQLFLWAILPVTFVIIALAFTGVYTHQQTMRDFVAERDLALARLTARMVEDGLAHGVVGIDGTGLAAWTSQMVGDQIGSSRSAAGWRQPANRPWCDGGTCAARGSRRRDR